MSRMLPPDTLPSCRFLSPRVLSWWRYDAHWLRQAYRCFNTLEAFTTTTGYLEVNPDTHHPLPDFSRLQGFSQTPTPVGTTGISPGLIPFSAIIARRDKYDSTRIAPRPQVFATSRHRRRPPRLAGLFHPAGTPRVLVFRVLPTTDRELSPVHPAPPLLPVLHGVRPDSTDACLASDRTGFTRIRPWLCQAPRPAVTGPDSVLDLGQP